jgi:2-polyprenyl-6-methoxyphenol hydroxylase-like FAD-dependent oxidoreductase
MPDGVAMDRHHNPRTDADHDVVVVGARVAGAATAMLLARQGLDVVVVDRATLPSDTLSTHAISRGGVVQLARWGLLDAVLDSGAPPIRTVSFHLPDGHLVNAVKDRNGVDHLVAPRRHILDAILLEAAVEAGATVHTGVAVTDTLTDASGRVTGVALRTDDGTTRPLHARFVVGADGIRSRIARSVGARPVDERAPGGSVAYVYVAGLDTDGFEFHLGDRAFAGVFPTHGGEANVWVCRPVGAAVPDAGNRTESFLEALASASPSLAERVRSARITSPVRTATGLPNHVLTAAGPGWALVGDAGYHRDPITGHGITDAFRDAELLARRLGPALAGEIAEAVALAGYAADRDRALLPIFDVTDQLAQFPPVEQFIELQKRLSTFIDAEAAELAALPPLPQLCSVAA